MTAAETWSPGVTCSPRHSPLPDNCSGVIFSGASLAPAHGTGWARGADRANAAIRPLTSPPPADAKRHQEPYTENTVMASHIERKEWQKYLSFVLITLQP